MNRWTMLALIAVPFLLGAVILWIFAGPVLLGGLRARQVLANGTPAEARVLDLQNTGTIINYQPLIAITLKVMPPGHPAYQAIVRKVLTPANEAYYQRGHMLRIKYDPAHPERVAIVGPAQ